jgi:hypothetical protein
VFPPSDKINAKAKREGNEMDYGWNHADSTSKQLPHRLIGEVQIE